MDYKKISAYIEGLYDKNTLSKKRYSDDTELKHYGQVIDDDVARMLQLLIMAKMPKMVLEIGTSIGYSTVAMAKMTKEYGGKIITIELDKQVAEQARANFKRQGVDEQIEIIIGDAFAVVADMGQHFDLIFQDVGDKTYYAKMMDSYVKLLNPGGLLLAEDVLFPAFGGGDSDSYLDDVRKPLDQFNRAVAQHPQFESTLLPIGDGLMVAVKKERVLIKGEMPNE
ncbi:MAG: O-methyltransferase [Spirochaetales bacterium]|jgi:predicted O-methyltransferase YrrM|nr:O-methyltransferase [Spirochaetales bacterium]